MTAVSTSHRPAAWWTLAARQLVRDFRAGELRLLALAVSLAVLVGQNKFKLPRVIDLMTRRGAEILNLPAGTLTAGAAADICLFNPSETWRYDTKAGFSKSTNSPWHGQTLTGRVKTTIVDGRVVFADGKIV